MPRLTTSGFFLCHFYLLLHSAKQRLAQAFDYTIMDAHGATATLANAINSEGGVVSLERKVHGLLRRLRPERRFRKACGKRK
jgi:hypothetical protein